MAVKEGKAKSDALVVEQISHYKKASIRFFKGYIDAGWEGPGRHQEDFGLACTIAFLTNHHWLQYLGLFMASEIYKRGKCANGKNEGYMLSMTTAAFVKQQKNASDYKKPKLPIAPKECRYTPKHRAIIELHESDPALRPREIAARLDVQPNIVRQVLHRWRKAGGLTVLKLAA